MAKKQKINWVIIVAVGGGLAYLLYSMTNNKAAKTNGNGNGTGTGTPFSSLPAGCYPFEEIHASYVKHLKETGLTADMWCIEIEGKHQIGGLYPYEYAVEVAKDFVTEEKS